MTPTLYYTVSIERRKIIDTSVDPDSAREAATRYTEKTGEQAVVCKAIDFYVAGLRVRDSDVSIKMFTP